MVVAFGKKDVKKDISLTRYLPKESYIRNAWETLKDL